MPPCLPWQAVSYSPWQVALQEASSRTLPHSYSQAYTASSWTAMREELNDLYAELEEVKSSPLDYLPDYGYSPKEEIIDLIEEDIRELEEELSEQAYDYEDDELEEERRMLCLSQGLSRWC